MNVHLHAVPFGGCCTCIHAIMLPCIGFRSSTALPVLEYHVRLADLRLDPKTGQVTPVTTLRDALASVYRSEAGCT